MQSEALQALESFPPMLHRLAPAGVTVRGTRPYFLAQAESHHNPLIAPFPPAPTPHNCVYRPPNQKQATPHQPSSSPCRHPSIRVLAASFQPTLWSLAKVLAEPADLSTAHWADWIFSAGSSIRRSTQPSCRSFDFRQRANQAPLALSIRQHRDRTTVPPSVRHAVPHTLGAQPAHHPPSLLRMP